YGLIRAPFEHAREADRYPALVPRRCGDAFESDFEHQLWLYGLHRAELLDAVRLYPTVYLRDLLIGEAAISFRKRYQCVAVPNGKTVISIESAAFAAALLGIDEHGVDRQWIDLPLPPVPAPAACLVFG